MTESTTIVASTIGAAVGIVGVLGLMLRILATNVARQFDVADRRFAEMARQFDELKTDMRSRFSEVNARLQRIETRIDDTNKRIDTAGRDIAELRDRTGALQGSLSTFMSERRGTSTA